MSMDDTSTPLAVEMGDADVQIGESRVGTVENKSWGFQKVVWIGGAVFVGTVIAALVFVWASAAKSPDPHSVTQMQSTGIADGATYLLKSNVSAYSYYLHVSSKSMSNGDPVYHTDSTTPGSQWQFEYVDGQDTTVMLRNLRSGFYLHVADEKQSSGDPVFHRDSTSEGSKWQIEYVPPHGSLIMLKSVRSGFYLHAEPRSKRTCCDPVFHTDSVTEGSVWLMESPMTDPPTEAPMTPVPTEAPMTPPPTGTPSPVSTVCQYNFTVLKARDEASGKVQLAEIEFESDGSRVDVTSATSPDTPEEEIGLAAEWAIDGDTKTKWRGYSVPASLMLTIENCVDVPDSFRFVTANKVEDTDPVRWRMQRYVEDPLGNDYWVDMHAQACADWNTPISRETATEWFPLELGAPPTPCPP
jgi:hypothetical protein